MLFYFDYENYTVTNILAYFINQSTNFLICAFLNHTTDNANQPKMGPIGPHSSGTYPYD